MSEKINGYSLTSDWFNFMAENSHKVECKHTAFYLYLVEFFNKRHWVKTVGLPTDFTMTMLNIKSYKSYIGILNDLVDFGFIIISKRATNQYTSTQIELVKNTKSNTKASTSHIPNQVEDIDQVKLSITKQVNNKRLNNKQYNAKFDFKKSLFDLVQDEQLVNDFLIVRKNKKSSNTETAFNGLIKKIKEANVSVKDAIKICVEKSWAGFDGEWLVKSGITIKSGSNEPNIEFYEGKQVYESNGRRYILKGESVKYIYPKEPNMEGWTEREIYNYRTCDRFNDTWAERYKNARDNQMNTTEAEKRGIYKYFYDQETLRFKIADHTNVRTS